jgi:t-SNARE complex subunit (syntaxin)
MALREDGFFGKELFRMRKDGTKFPVSLSAAPIRDGRGNIVGIIAAAEDISRRKKAEEEVRMHQEHLQELVEEKTRELRERVDELERFHDATVEREFRIKELRDEIEALKRGSDE